MKGNLYCLDTSTPETTQALVAVNMELWHRRLGHVPPPVISHMANNNIASGLKISKSRSEYLKCEGCILGKGHRAPILRKSESKTSALLELVHSDLNGPLDVPSLGGSHYFVTFIDDFSKWATVYTMKKKSDTLACFKKYHALAEKHTGSKVKSVNVIQRRNVPEDKTKAIRTDN